MRNLELKARCADLDAAAERAERLGARRAGALEQRDTFFAATHARLKLRELGDGGAELIAYRRPDTAAARGSDYELCPVAEPARLAAVLAHALGTTGRVEKRRVLYLYEHTRIHLDRVRGLGDFVELETVVTDQPESEARAELVRVAAALALGADDLVAEAYVDLVGRGGR